MTSSDPQPKEPDSTAAGASRPAGPLSGKIVVDLSRVLAGPWAAQMLADLGAEVIKIERPVKGDDSRGHGPIFLRDTAGNDTPNSPMFLAANRGKQSLTLDIASRKGQDIVRKLAARADVFIENFKVGDLERYGLDYPSLSEVNTRLVYCSITGYGQTGPYSKRPGYDPIFQAMSGLMSVTGIPDGQPGAGPMKVGPSIVDFIGGQFAVSAILAALYERDTGNGRGRQIDIALLDAAIASTTHYAQQFLMTGVPPLRRGSEGNGGMPAGAFASKDGQFMLTAGNDRQFIRLAEMLGQSGWATDPRFSTNAARVQNRVLLCSMLDREFLKWGRDDLIAALVAADVPAGPIQDFKEVFDSEHARTRGMSFETLHAVGPVKLVGNPIHMPGIDLDRIRPPPMLGEHTDEVLSRHLGMSNGQIAALRAEGVV